MAHPRAFLWMAPLILGLALGLSGCVASDAGAGLDGNANTESPSASASANATATGTGKPGPSSSTNSTAPSNGTGNETGSGTDNATTKWTYENRTGTVSGNELIVLHPATKKEAFNVTNGSLTLTLDLATQGSDLSMTVRGADCTQASCEKTVKTASGKANLTFAAPANGTWSATLAIASGLGPVSSSYKLIIGLESAVPPANATTEGNATGNATGNSTSSTTTSGSSSATSTTSTATSTSRSTTTSAASSTTSYRRA